MNQITERLIDLFDSEGERYEESIKELDDWVESRVAIRNDSESRWEVQQDLQGSVTVYDRIGPEKGQKHLVGE